MYSLYKIIIYRLKKNGGELRMDKLEEMMCDAAAGGHFEKLKRLLEAGADPNVTDYDGRSALVYSISNLFYQFAEKRTRIHTHSILLQRKVT